MMEIRDMIRRQYHVYGRVQGVGFRYTVTQAADALGLTGWVCNERDGSVTTELQGSEEAMDKLWEMVRNGSFIRIDGYDMLELSVDKSERGFQVRR